MGYFNKLIFLSYYHIGLHELSFGTTATGWVFQHKREGVNFKTAVIYKFEVTNEAPPAELD